MNLTVRGELTNWHTKAGVALFDLIIYNVQAEEDSEDVGLKAFELPGSDLLVAGKHTELWYFPGSLGNRA
jgi:hypothetical protein